MLHVEFKLKAMNDVTFLKVGSGTLLTASQGARPTEEALIPKHARAEASAAIEFPTLLFWN